MRGGVFEPVIAGGGECADHVLDRAPHPSGLGAIPPTDVFVTKATPVEIPTNHRLIAHHKLAIEPRVKKAPIPERPRFEPETMKLERIQQEKDPKSVTNGSELRQNVRGTLEQETTQSERAQPEKGPKCITNGLDLWRRSREWLEECKETKRI
jgi:hypothetical protein